MFNIDSIIDSFLNTSKTAGRLLGNQLKLPQRPQNFLPQISPEQQVRMQERDKQRAAEIGALFSRGRQEGVNTDLIPPDQRYNILKDYFSTQDQHFPNGLPGSNPPPQQITQQSQDFGAAVDPNRVGDRVVEQAPNQMQQVLGVKDAQASGFQFDGYLENNPASLKTGGSNFAQKFNSGVDSQGHYKFPDFDTGMKAGAIDHYLKFSGNTRHQAIKDPNATIADLNSVYATDSNWKNNVASNLSKILGQNITPDTNFRSVPPAILTEAIMRSEDSKLWRNRTPQELQHLRQLIQQGIDYVEQNG